MKETFVITKEKKLVDKFTYWIMELTDQQTRQDKQFLYCAMYKRLSWKDEKPVFAEKTDKEKFIAIWLMSPECAKLHFALDQLLYKRCIKQKEMREIFDYLKSLKVSIEITNREWAAYTSPDWVQRKTRDTVWLIITLFRPWKMWSLKVFNIWLNYTFEMDENNEKIFTFNNSTIIIWNKDDWNQKMRTWFVTMDFFETHHFNTMLSRI